MDTYLDKIINDNNLSNNEKLDKLISSIGLVAGEDVSTEYINNLKNKYLKDNRNYEDKVKDIQDGLI